MKGNTKEKRRRKRKKKKTGETDKRKKRHKNYSNSVWQTKTKTANLKNENCTGLPNFS